LTQKDKQIIERLKEEKILFEKDMKILEVNEKEIVDELGRNEHVMKFAVRFYILRCNQTLERIIGNKK